MKTINIVHLYPKEMNIYGDNGNLLILLKRLQWRGIKANLINVGVGENIPLKAHMIIGGGGQDAGQQIIAEDLKNKSVTIAKMCNNGIPMLMICGMYQMFGHYFKTQSGEIIKGIGILDLYTVAEPGRLIGNICSATKWGELIGYENHSGRTYISNKNESFGKTKLGQGNNGKDLSEGAVFNNVFGSYLHGPVLSKAPNFADHLLKQSLVAAGITSDFAIINNNLEDYAASVAKSRPR